MPSANDASRLGVQTRLQEKRITIVHARDNPLSDTYPAKYRDCVKAGVTARKVDMVLGEFVEEFPPSGSGDFIFKSEQKLNASRVVSLSRHTPFTNSTGMWQVVALGPKPNTDFIEESFGPSALTKTKLVKVKKTLQLASHPAIFAVGDIVDWKEQTQAAKAIGHAPVVAANVVNLLAGRPIRNEYGGFPEVIAIANFGKVGEFAHCCSCYHSPASAATERTFHTPSFPLGNRAG